MKAEEQWISLSGASIEMHPFPHFAGTEIINYNGEALLHEWLASYTNWELTEASFYTQFEFSLLDAILPLQLQWIIGEGTLSNLKQSFINLFSLQGIELIGITAHQLVDGHKIGIHNDYIEGQETHRLVIQLNPGWEDDNGGYLMLFDRSDPPSVAKILRPVNNSYFGFEISQKSYHAVSRVNNYSRYTLVYTLKGF